MVTWQRSYTVFFNCWRKQDRKGCSEKLCASWNLELADCLQNMLQSSAVFLKSQFCTALGATSGFWAGFPQPALQTTTSNAHQVGPMLYLQWDGLCKNRTLHREWAHQFILFFEVDNVWKEKLSCNIQSLMVATLPRHEALWQIRSKTSRAAKTVPIKKKGHIVVSEWWTLFSSESQREKCWWEWIWDKTKQIYVIYCY